MNRCLYCGDTETASQRDEFECEMMCDFCFGEACSNASNDGEGDTLIDTKAFNEIKRTNRRKNI